MNIGPTFIVFKIICDNRSVSEWLRRNQGEHRAR